MNTKLLGYLLLNVKCLIHVTCAVTSLRNKISPSQVK